MDKTWAEISIELELHIQLLGGFSVSVDGVRIPDESWRSRRVRSLVKLLALTHDHRLHRDQVIEALWPDSDFSSAVNNFHQTLYAARRVLEAAGANCLLLEDGFLSLTQADGQALAVDLEQFETAAAHAKGSHDPRAYQDAVALYTGDLLPEDPYEEWVLPRREVLKQVYLNLLLDLARLHETRGEYPQGIAALQRLLSVDHSHEEAHAGLMRLYALSGLRQQAIRQYRTLCEVLCQELEAEPSQSTSRLFELIQSGGFTPGLPRVQSAHNLPVQVTSFIGREKQIAALKQIILSGQARLVTVTGAGGTGKTRLALRAAEELLDAFPQGVWLVELAAVTDPDLVPAAVAAVLKQHESPNKSILEVLVDFLRSKQVLIILDTCEHLVGAVANLVDLILHTSSRVTILTTSREILGVSGEMSLLCPNLGLPDPHLLQPHLDMGQYSVLISGEAVRLFAERSALASPTFEITPKNALTVAKVCRRLDGIPLAIELAAARTRLLSVEKIAERLDHAFILLTCGSRTALPRQQTLKATIDWSYNLLTPAERALLLRLSIFSGGWTLEAAEAVCAGGGANGNNLLSEEILNLLGRLADKSLILVEPGIDGEPRYRMLDTIRQYAHDRLLERGGDSLVRERHQAYFLQLAEQAEPHLRARGMVAWLHRLDVELGNLRLALEWSLSASIIQGLSLGSALLWFWHIRSRRLEGALWLDRLLEADAAGPPVQLRPPSSRIVRGKALVVAGYLNQYFPGAYAERGCRQLNEGKTIFLELGDLGQKYLPSAMYHTACSEEEYRESLALARKVGDEFYAAESLRYLAMFMEKKGDLTQAAAYDQENLAIRQKIGDVDGEAAALCEMGYGEFMQGNPQRAIEFFEAGKHCFQAEENVEFGLFLSGAQARVVIAQGDYQRALQIGEAALAAGQEISSGFVVADALENISWAYWALKEYDQFAHRCAELLGPDWEDNQSCFWRHLQCNFGSLHYIFGRFSLSQGKYARARAYFKNISEFYAPEKFLALQALGILAAAQAEYRRAAVVFGALEQLVGWLKNVSSPAERDEYEQALASTRTALGEEAFAAAWGEGKAMTLEQMEALALEDG